MAWATPVAVGLVGFRGVRGAVRDEHEPIKVCQDVWVAQSFGALYSPERKVLFTTWHHECVQPKHAPQDSSAVATAVSTAQHYEGAAEAAAVAAAAASGTVAAVQAAGSAAAQSAAEDGMKTTDQVTAGLRGRWDDGLRWRTRRRRTRPRSWGVWGCGVARRAA